MVLEQLKDRAQRSSDRLSTRVQELKSQRLSVQNEAESKMDGVRGLERQLEELGDNVSALYTQIEALEAEKSVLERKASRVKERRRTHGVSHIPGFSKHYTSETKG